MWTHKTEEKSQQHAKKRTDHIIKYENWLILKVEKKKR